MIYLTNAVDIPDEYRDYFGHLASSIHHRNCDNELGNGAKWLLDNDAFSGNFDTAKWLQFMLKYQDYKDNCIGVTIPDVLGDALQTLRIFSQYWRIVKDLGFPVAFVTQDGITPEITPWDYFETMFVGGTDGHKLSNEAGIMIAEARQRGKWIHVGRVNSERRIKQFWFADSVDGTQFSIIGMGSNGETRRERQLNDMKRFSAAIEFCRAKKSGFVNTNGQYILKGE